MSSTAFNNGFNAADAQEDFLFVGEAALEGEGASEASFDAELEALVDQAGDLDAFESEEFEDALEEAEGFRYSADSGLFVPLSAGRLLGPDGRPISAARALNPFVLSALDSDEADEFFGRIFKGIRNFVGRAGKALGRVGRVVAPFLKRALPMIQKVVGFAGPWGRLISAGIGATQGLIEGKGLKGALAGALGGALPGIGGNIAKAVLSGDGADDDAAMDVVADLADARRIHPGVALPLASGLATRLVLRRAGLRGKRVGRPVERALLGVAARLKGSPGRRVRVLRSIARQTTAYTGGLRGPAAARVLRPALQKAARRVLGRVRQVPAAGVSSAERAIRRLEARQAILDAVPISAIYPRYPDLAA